MESFIILYKLFALTKMYSLIMYIVIRYAFFLLQAVQDYTLTFYLQYFNTYVMCFVYSKIKYVTARLNHQ